MTSFTIKTDIVCGETTCASEPGVFCGELGAKALGTKPHCLHFDEQLVDVDGWVQRCDRCLRAEKESK